MPDHCPGTANLRTPTLAIKKCPQCGEEVEIFSNDGKVACGNCGFIIYNDILSCIQWCRYAKECVGEETYRNLVEKKEEPKRPGSGDIPKQ
jgi:protein-arginine kinase activator protein McsA